MLRTRPGALVEVVVGGDTVITGRVDKLDGSHAKDQHSLSLTGRSLTRNLVDCSPKGPTDFRRKSPEQIVRALAGPYGVEVVVEEDLGEKLPRFDLNEGELVGAAIQRLAQVRGFVATDDAAGRLVLTRGGAVGRADVDLVVGENVLGGSGTLDASGVFSEYRIKGVRLGNDNDFGEVLQSVGTAADDIAGSLEPGRLLELQAESGEDLARCRERAAWEAATRYGQAISLSYEVQGWRQRPGGRLWELRELVYVRDDLLGISGDFLVVDVDMVLGLDGTRTRLGLAPPEAFELLPPAAKRKGAKGKRARVRGPFDTLQDGVELTERERRQ